MIHDRTQRNSLSCRISGLICLFESLLPFLHSVSQLTAKPLVQRICISEVVFLREYLKHMSLYNFSKQVYCFCQCIFMKEFVRSHTMSTSSLELHENGIFKKSVSFQTKGNKHRSECNNKSNVI